MAHLRYRVRTDLRQRRWSAVGLATLVAVAAVVPFTAAAAARRTDSALDRMREDLRPAHGDVQFEEDEAPPDAVERIGALPGVESVGEGVAMLARPVGSDLDFFEAFGQGAYGDELMRTFDRARIDAGRMPESADETMLSRSVARDLGLGVGDRVEIETFTPEGLWAALDGESFDYDGTVVDLEVVGVGQQPEEITGGGPEAVAPAFVVSEAFLERHDGEIGWFDGVFVVRLDGGVGAMPSFERAVREEFADRDDVGINTSEEQARVEQAVDAQTVGLALLALASAVAACVAVGQAVARFARGREADAQVLGAVGLTSRELSLGRTVTAGVPVLAGATVAVIAATLASTAFPTGAAGRVEPDPGVVADAVVLLPGLLLALLLGTVAAVTAVRRAPRPHRTSFLDQRIARASLPLSATSGLRAAFSTRSLGAPPLRSAMIAGVAGVAAVVAAAVFGASLTRLVDTPARYGWNWDLDVGLGDNLTDEEALRKAEGIGGDERIDGAMVVRIDNLVIEDREEFVFARSPIVGDLNFTVVAGRTAERPGEVALGGTTMDALGVSIGDTVEAAGADDEAVPLRVVGQALFPVVENEDPARGVALSLETYDRLHSPGIGFPELYVQAVPGTELDALAADLERLGFVARDVPPPVVNNLRGVDEVPLALAAFLAVLALAASIHALVSAVRRRQRELAVLKTLGFVRRQLATTVLVQGLTFGAVGLVIGLPLGFAVGREAWRAVADGLGFANDVVTPAWVAFIVPGVALVLILVAALPARSAARTPAATLLRTE